MRTHLVLAKNLRYWVRAILNGKLSLLDLDNFVALCHSLAIVAVRTRISSYVLRTKIREESHSDVAYDCIAELFQQDDKGHLVQLKAYFEGLPWEEASDELLLTHLRRLVFSKVNHGIYRIYQAADPTLSKILRNVKVAIQNLNNFTLVERFGEHLICPTQCDPLEHLTLPGYHDLEIAISRTCNGSENIPTLLARLSRYLREQNDHCRMAPLIITASVFRSLYQKGEDHLLIDGSIDESLAIGEVHIVIAKKCTEVKTKMSGSYVGKKKLSPEIYDLYFEIIEEKIVENLISQNGSELSYFAALKQRLPDLDRKTYASKHRAVLEYLGSMVLKSTRAALRESESEAAGFSAR